MAGVLRLPRYCRMRKLRNASFARSPRRSVRRGALILREPAATGRASRARHPPSPARPCPLRPALLLRCEHRVWGVLSLGRRGYSTQRRIGSLRASSLTLSEAIAAGRCCSMASHTAPSRSGNVTSQAGGRGRSAGAIPTPSNKAARFPLPSRSRGAKPAQVSAGHAARMGGARRESRQPIPGTSQQSAGRCLAQCARDACAASAASSAGQHRRAALAFARVGLLPAHRNPAHWTRQMVGPAL